MKKKDSQGGRKWQAYERNGVPHCWLVDPDTRTVTQYEYREGHFVEVARLRGDDTLRYPLFPTLTRTVAELFANVRD